MTILPNQILTGNKVTTTLWMSHPSDEEPCEEARPERDRRCRDDVNINPCEPACAVEDRFATAVLATAQDLPARKTRNIRHWRETSSLCRSSATLAPWLGAALSACAPHVRLASLAIHCVWA